MENTNYTTSQTTGNGSAATRDAANKLYSDAKGAAQRTGETLRSELSVLKQDLDDLMSRSSSMSDEELSRAHAQLMAKFSSLRYAARGFADEATRQWTRGMETTNQYVKEKPMQSVGLAVGTGLLLGLLFSRR
ncbi:MAG TPA: DUF883 domain-containing protein [Noviherbaspirillum sp.]|nr:DUF883 domain-containing protein [Noviherbaspirillum sp.]